MLLGRKPMGTVSYMGGVPAVLENFCWSWGQLIAFNCEALETSKEYIHYGHVTYSDHAPARNTLATEMLGNWILMLDTDHQFDPDILKRILILAKDTGAEVISGLYRFKMPPFSAVAYSMQDGKSSPIISWPPELEMIKISACGGGCLWFTRRVYNQLLEEYKCGPFDRFIGLSEDHSFFKRCRDSGIDAYLATKIEAQHLRVVPVTNTDEESVDTLSVLMEGYHG